MDCVDDVVEDMKDLTMPYMVNNAVDEDNTVHEMSQVVSLVDLDVVKMMVAQGLLEAVERCLEGTEEAANPSDVVYVVDDVHHSFGGVVDVHLVHDALLKFDVEIFLDDDLEGLSVLDAVELQSLILDDLLDLHGQHDVLFLLYDDVDVDAFLDDGDLVVDHDVALFPQCRCSC